MQVVIECVLYRDGLAPKRNDREGTERFSRRRLTLLALGKSADNPAVVALYKRFDTLAAGVERCAGVDLTARCDAQVEVLDALFGNDDGDGRPIRSG